MIPTLLGGLSVDTFLADYWQKKPLLVRGAIPGFTGVHGLTSSDELLALAARDDMESRFVAGNGIEWRLDFGPFKPRSVKRQAKPWTVLVQGINLANTGADALLREFSFIPYARLDDLMVSYATDGGGVGPHFDSYDVFLLQGMGRRRWRIGRQKRHHMVEGLPLRILADFRPSQEWLLEPGDMLYLPPEWAHDGIAEGDCMTWSVGFRAFPAQELAEQFLIHLQDRLDLTGRYADPDLRLQKHPAEIGKAMVDRVAALADRIRWDRDSIAEFLGCLLTEPKPLVVFSTPEPVISKGQFSMQARRQGVQLDLRSQLLFSGVRFFINGETVAVPRIDQKSMRQLADRRRIDYLEDWSPAGMDLLYEWYRCGFISLCL